MTMLFLVCLGVGLSGSVCGWEGCVVREESVYVCAYVCAFLNLLALFYFSGYYSDFVVLGPGFHCLSILHLARLLVILLLVVVVVVVRCFSVELLFPSVKLFCCGCLIVDGGQYGAFLF